MKEHWISLQNLHYHMECIWILILFSPTPTLRYSSKYQRQGGQWSSTGACSRGAWFVCGRMAQKRTYRNHCHQPLLCWRNCTYLYKKRNKFTTNQKFRPFLVPDTCCDFTKFSVFPVFSSMYVFLALNSVCCICR